MVSFEKVKEVHGWLVDREAFEPKATKSKVNISRQLFGLEYKVPEEGFLVSESRIVGDVEEGYFHLVVFVCGLKFLIPNFMVEVLRAYNIALS